MHNKFIATHSQSIGERHEGIVTHLLCSFSELAKELKTIKRDVPIILYSGTMPTNLQNIDVYINKDEPTVGFLRIVREVVERFCS